MNESVRPPNLGHDDDGSARNVVHLDSFAKGNLGLPIGIYLAKF